MKKHFNHIKSIDELLKKKSVEEDVNEYIAQVREILDDRYLFNTRTKGFPREYLFDAFKADMLEGYNTDISSEECADIITRNVASLIATI